MRCFQFTQTRKELEMCLKNQVASALAKKYKVRQRSNSSEYINLKVSSEKAVKI